MIAQKMVHSTLKHPVTGLPLEAVGVVRGKPVWPVLGAAEDLPEGDPGKGDPPKKTEDKTFTQADIDRITAEMTSRHKAEIASKYGDYNDLKQKVQGAQSAEEKLAELQKQLADTQRESLMRSIQAEHGISNDDAALFLTGSDKDTLERQAQRVKELAEEKAKGKGGAPREGRNGRPTVSDEKQAVRTLFG